MNDMFHIPLDKKECVVSSDNTMEIMFSISYENSKVVALNIRLFKDFLSGIDYTITKAITTFNGTDTDVEITFSVKGGICSIRAKVNPATKINYKFPVSDACSFGKITLTVDDLRTIKEYLKEHQLI